MMKMGFSIAFYNHSCYYLSKQMISMILGNMPFTVSTVFRSPCSTLKKSGLFSNLYF